MRQANLARPAARRPIVPVALASLLALALAATTAAQSDRQPEQLDHGWHVIRPGDTLESLAADYLGSPRLWTEIHQLNPGIDDPHWIYPGRRIRVVLQRPSAAPNAQIESTSRRVEEHPTPVPWQAADTGDLLLERDGLRTFGGASALLRFDDGTTATLSEDSLVFIRRQTPATAPTPRKEIEIELGQADLETHPGGSRPAPEIEIVVSGARSRDRAAPGGKLRTRARRRGKDAEFMLYEGDGKLSAAGHSVQLAAGTGSVVHPKSAPTPPEPLLPAPVALEPPAEGELGRDDPVLSWQAVPSADHYVVEVCGDAACGALLERVGGLKDTSARLAQTLPDAGGYWRVTAVASSGLDGFPGAARHFLTVASVHPPAPVVRISLPNGRAVADGACVPGAPKITVEAHDILGHPLPATLLIDGQPAGDDPATRFTASGTYEISASTRDAKGRTASSAPLRVRVDQASPWIELTPAVGGPALPPPPRRSKHHVAPPPVDLCAIGLEVEGADGAWLPVACQADGEPTKVELSGDTATLHLRSSAAGLVVGELRAVDAGQVWDISTGDSGCGLAAAELRVEPSPYSDGRAALELVVRDGAGRRSSSVWHLDRR